MSKLKNPVLMAIVGAAHGIKGEVRVKTFTGDPLALGDYGTLRAADGRGFRILALRPQKEVLVVRFEGVSDRNAAETLSGTELFVDRSVLPDHIDEDEFYHADLIGLAVLDETGARIGTVKALHDFGAGDILEIATAQGRTELVPFTKAAVPFVDVPGGTMAIDSIAAGLAGDGEEDETVPGPEGTGDRDAEITTRKPRPADRPRGPRQAGGDR